MSMIVGPRPSSASRVEMTEIVLPVHANALGTIFGGTVMQWIDIAASVAGMRHAGSSVVTASIDGLQFLSPIHVGEVVTLRASVNFVGRTSMEIGVRVEAENPRSGSGEHRYTTKAYLTFVAVDDKGLPRLIAPLELESDEDRRRHADAQARRRARLGARG
jgi:acyl-CoA hydrolase